MKHLQSSKFRPFSHLFTITYMLLKLTLELSGCGKYTIKIVNIFGTSVLLLCKCKLSFKFVVIPKIKVSTLFQNRKLRSRTQLSCTERKSFQRNDDGSKETLPIKITPIYGSCISWKLWILDYTCLEFFVFFDRKWLYEKNF